MDTPIPQLPAGASSPPTRPPATVPAGTRGRMQAGALSGWHDKPVPANVADPDAYRAARGFEAHFAQYLVKQMRGEMSMIGGKGAGGEVFEGMFNEVMGDEIAAQGGLGITDMVYRDMMAQRGHDPYLDGEPGNPAPAATLLGGQLQWPEAVSRPRPTPPLLEPTPELTAMVDETADRHGVDRDLVHAVIRAESGWNPYAVSHKGARGLMQLMPATADSLGVTDIHDPAQNLDGGVRYLRMMLDRFGGDTSQALAAYNAGPEAVEDHEGIPPFEETQEYVSRIIGWITGRETDDDVDRAGDGVRSSHAELARLEGRSSELMRVARDFIHPQDSPAAARPVAGEEEG